MLLNCSTMSDSAVLFSSDDEESDAHHEVNQYNSFKSMLKGVPPPSSITISKFTVDEMLQKYQEHKESYGFGITPDLNNSSTKKNPVPFLNYLNSSHMSESIASLVMKVQERYVQMETMSSCNIWFNATLQTCGSAKKRMQMRQRFGFSPGRRLSHLARRRQFFSSANLQHLASSVEVRQIEIKKNEHGQHKALNRSIPHDKLNSSKRALFMSPEEGTPIKYGNSVSMERKIYSSGSDDRKKLPLQERSKKVEVMRWLSQQNFDSDNPRKRLREECANHSDERKRKCPRRSLNFGDEDAVKSRSSVATSESSSATEKKASTSVVKLSQNHKNKLLWAVSVVLKENNIARSDENFKACASTLFHKCKKNFDEILRSETGSGTSDKILMYAKKQIPDIFKTLNIPFVAKYEMDANTESGVVGPSDSKNNLELKENINRNNCTNGAEENLFKTPMKVRRKRVVKSCQKPSVEKRRGLRRWHSLESLIENYMKEMQEKDDDKCNLKVCPALGALNRELAEDSDKGSPCETAVETCPDGVKYIPESPSTASELVDNDRTPCKTLETLETEVSVMFSPIPSSVKESSDSSFVLFPALCPNKIECTPEVQITNQDNEMEAGIETVVSSSESGLHQLCEFPQQNADGTCPLLSDNMDCKESVPEDLEKGDEELEAPTVEYNEEAVLTEDNEHGTSCNVSEAILTEAPALSTVPVSVGGSSELSHVASPIVSRKDIDREDVERTGESKAPETEMSEETNECVNMIPDMCSISACSVDRETMEADEISTVGKDKSKEETNEVADTGNDIEPPILTGSYKPRKLVVKKSKPNWKVVRKDSEEAENECELRLKMRLSHEWEIVHRNSSCSEMANNSECEMSGLYCSQSSSVNGGRYSSSEVEQESDWLRPGSEDKEVLSSVKEGEMEERCDETRLNSSMFETDGADNIESNFEGCDDSYYKNNFCGDVLSSTLNVVGNEQDDLEVVTKEGGSVNKTCDGAVMDNFVAEENNCHVENDTLSEICVINEKYAIKAAVDFTLDEDRASPILIPRSHSSRKSREKSDVEREHSREENLDLHVSEIVGDKRRRGDDDSDSNSSSSCWPQRKKRVLSLEKYKARKSEETPSEAKSRTPPSEWSESGETSVEEVTNSGKKIYNITLKRPEDRKSRKEYKHRERRNKSRERHRNRGHSLEGRRSDPRLHRSGDSAKVLSRSQPDESEVKPPGPDVKVQTIVNALSALSNLVEKQIKMEEEKMELRRSSGGENETQTPTVEDGKWMDVVSTWCGNYLSNASATGPIEGGSDGVATKQTNCMGSENERPHQNASAGKTVGTWELTGNGFGSLGHHTGKTPGGFAAGPTPCSWPAGGCGSAPLTIGNVQICRNSSMEYGVGGIVASPQGRRRVPEGVADDYASGSLVQNGLNYTDVFACQSVQNESYTSRYPSVQYQQTAVYPLGNDYASVWKSYYQPSVQPVYNNYGTWQFPVGANDWNYQQSGDTYQACNYFAYQMSDVKYYYNNF